MSFECFIAMPHKNNKVNVVVVVLNIFYPALLYIMQTSEHRRPTTDKDAETTDATSAESIRIPDTTGATSSSAIYSSGTCFRTLGNSYRTRTVIPDTQRLRQDRWGPPPPRRWTPYPIKEARHHTGNGNLLGQVGANKPSHIPIASTLSEKRTSAHGHNQL